MRRILLVLAVLASGLLAAPSAAGAPPDQHGASASVVQAQNIAASSAIKEAAEAAGWETMAVHYLQGWWQGRKGWYNDANGRFYYMWATMSMDHDPPAGKWRPVFHGECSREYGNAKATQRCNFDVEEFHALVSPNGVTVNSVGQRAFNYQCVYRTQAEHGIWRTYGSTYPWVMSYVDGYSVRFVTDSCTHIHLSQDYPVGSFMFRPATGSVIEHEWTGGPGWTRDHDVFG